MTQATEQTDATHLLRAYQAQEKQFVERRFPLRFEPEVPVIRELYSQAKGLRWNPVTDIAWDRLDVEAYSADTREAARLTWSRRAWGTYPGLSESTALLLRLCLESGSVGMDAKLFLSFRPAEEAKHLETCYLLAERFGGYVSNPDNPDLRDASSHPFAQAALDRDLPVEAFVAALGTLDDQFDLNLDFARLQLTRDEVVRQALRLMASDKQRHVLFAWAFLGSRVGELEARSRDAVIDAVREVLERVILAGYRNAWLLPAASRGRWLGAEEETATQGLGAASADAERRVLRATVAQLRERLAVWGLELPPVSHPELGSV